MTVLGYTNVVQMTLFKSELLQYEGAVTPNSGVVTDYHQAVDMLKKALTRLVRTQGADVYTMMRHLVNRIIYNRTTFYSDFTISMLATATRDERAKQLILNILYVTREMVIHHSFDDQLNLEVIDDNVDIVNFLQSYFVSDRVIPETINDDDILKPPTKLDVSQTKNAEYDLHVGYFNYDVSLVSEVPQLLTIKNAPGAFSGQSSKITIVPGIGKFYLSKDTIFYEDALRQLLALNCTPEGYDNRKDTLIELPYLFCSMVFEMITVDKGQTWYVSEVNIFPPTVDRTTEQ